MKKYITHWLVFFVLFFVVSSIHYEAKGQVSGSWSGTISFHERNDGKKGMAGSFSETLVNITITDNKAKGIIDINSENVWGGKSLCKGSCIGSGDAELNEVSLNFEKSTYSIKLISPQFDGTNKGLWCDLETTHGTVDVSVL